MIIKELYVDHFLEDDDLTLADLSDQLNVVCVPSAIEAESLHAFIPSMLFGERGDGPLGAHEDRSLPEAAGSALIQIGPRLFELLRLVDGDMAGLHILDEQGQDTDCPLHGWLKRLTMPTYLAVFTDCFLISERLEQWRTSGLIRAFADESAAQAARPNGDDTALADEVQKLKRHIRRLIRQRSEILVELISGPDTREDYVNARATVHEAEQRVDQISSQLERSQQQIEPLELALQLVKPWQRQTTLTAQVDELRALRVRSKDMSRLQRAERQLTESRAKLRALRAQVDDRPKDEPVVEGLDAEAQSLLGQREEALQRLRRSEQLQQELLDGSQTEQRDRASVVDAVHQVKDVASRLRDARHRFHAATQHARQMAQHDAREASCASPPDESELQSVDEIRERIKQLKAETHQLLKRRLLPPPIVLTLGAVFAVGVSGLLAALLLDLRGFDAGVGAMGVTAMLAAALLKLSFERPPDQKLRAHRERIQRLLKEVQERELVGQTNVPADDSIRPRIVIPDEPPTDSPKASPQIRQELDDAYQDWVSLLSQYDLEPDVSPRDAVVEVRRRHAEQSDLRPDDSSTLQLEHDEHRRWLDRYRESVTAFLAARPHDITHSRLEYANWEQLLARLDSEFRVVATEEAGPRGERPSPRQMGEVQRQIKEMKRARDRILDRAGARDADDLKSQIERKQELSNLEVELQRAQQQISRELSDVDFAADVKRLLDGQSDADLKRQHSCKQADVKRFKAQLKEANTELDAAREVVQKLSSDHTRINLRLQLNLIEAQLVEATEQLRVAQFGRQAAGQLSPSLPAAGEPSHALREASRLLQACRQVPCHLQFDSDRNQFLFVDQSHSAIPVRELGRNDVELIVMCLQLALVRHLGKESGIRLPLVFTDHSLGYPAEHAMQIGQLLSEGAGQGSQTFLFSCHDAVCDLFHQLGVPTLVVERTESADVVPAEYDREEDDRIENVANVDAVVDTVVSAPKPDNIVESEEADWIPVEYHVVEPHNTQSARPSAAPVNGDSNPSTGLPVSDKRPLEDPSARLDQVGSAVSSRSKRFRLDRPHNDLPRSPTPRRSSISAGDDELPEWWPD